jgi:hypothetical protein
MTHYGLPPETVEALPSEILDLLEQGVLPEQVMTDEWDGDPYFTEDGRIREENG